MEWDPEKIDEAVLGLLHLTLHDGCHAWKGFAWASLARLHDKGLIEDPVNKNKSVVLTPYGLEVAARVAEARFRSASGDSWRALKAKPGVQHRSAAGVRGVICRDFVTGRSYFRIYRDGSFDDYELRHDELSVQVDNDAMASFYRGADRPTLDHNPRVLGIAEADHEQE